MNKNRHRIIFNAARGQRMVVSESASSVSGGSAAGETSAPGSEVVSLGDLEICKPSVLRNLALHPLTLSIGLALTLGLVFVSTARAQIVADPSAPGNQRPTILQTGNGLPQINIQSPSAAGVSRNIFSQFDVDSRGAILNNSRTNVQTQTGGMIAGNAWLATGEARVILNEVRSSNPSYLNGYVEVAGRRAEVIVANPAGISVNGGGFINSAGVTLTTGTPVMNSGHLEAFRVGGGKVRIEGLGLDTSTADYTAILARALEVNASLWAKNLTAVTGTNEVKALASGADAQATKIASSGGEPAPNFMLDVAAIGGMYAGKIYLVGTEAGLGINNRGSLQAHEGEWVLKADGSLINTGKVQAKGDLSIQTTGAVSNTGPDALISSQGNATVQAGTTIANTSGAQIAATGTLGVNAVGALDNTTGTIAADGAVQVTAAGIHNSQGSVVSSQSTLSLNSGTQALVNTQGNLEAAQAITVTSGAVNNSEGLIQAIGTLNVTAAGDLNNTEGQVVAGGAMNVSAQDIDNTQGTFTAHQGATLTSTTLNNDQGVIQAVNTLDVRATGELNNSEGTLVSGGAAQITAADIDNVQGTIASDQTLTIDSASLTNHQGTVQALDALNIHTSGHALTNTQGLLLAGGSMGIEVGAIDNTQGTVAAQQDVTLTSTTLNNDKGLIQAVGTLNIDTQGHTLTNTNASGHGSGAGGIVAGTAATLTTGALDNTAGEVLSTGTLNIDTTGALTNVTGRLQGVGATDINTHGQALDNTAGRVASQSTLALTTGALTNDAQAGQGGVIGSQGNLTIQAGATTNGVAGAGGASGAARPNIWSAQTASVTASSFSNAGVLSGGNVALNTTTDLNNAAGASIEANGDLSITVTGANLHNAGDLIANQTLTVNATDITNTGSLDATDQVLTATGTFTNAAGASITAANSIDIGATTFTNRGLINANEAPLNSPASQVHIHADTVNNLGTGTIFGDRIAIAATTLNNRPETAGGTGPVIAAREQFDIGAQTLNNEDGALLYSGGSMAMGGALDAALAATGQMQALNNLSADIEVTDNLRISALTLTNQRRGASAVSQVQVVDETATLAMPGWWVNGKNEHGKAIEATSNYSTRQYYLLDPASIVSETPLVTPDGNVIYRVEVNLSATDSVYHAAGGAYGGQYGVRERVGVGSGTVVLYAMQRQTGVTNPDQVAGTPDVFTSDISQVIYWQRNSLSYSDAYGRCTTNCTMFVVETGYSDPQGTMLRGTQRNINGAHSGYEISRTSHHSAVEDRLNPEAGATAAIRSGGSMQLAIGSALNNRFADILAGGVLDVQATGATVTNTGQTLKRTHSFQITSTTVTEDTFDWTAPDISEVIGHAGGNLSGAQALNITAKNLTNSDLARTTGLPTSGLGFLGVTLPTASTPITVPNNPLFQPATPGSSHLIQGAPAFTGSNTWLGSDYLIVNLGSDPNLIQKRLGDGFYEQKFVREQVAQLTGRRFLDGYANDEAQYRALMDAGVTFAQQWNLVPGIALSAEQMALLTTDLVWLVEREVILPDGTKTTALVPQVYVRQVPEGDFQASGALLAGNQVNLQIEEDLINAGGRIEGGVVIAQAGRDLSNIGGLMQARTELLAGAGRNVTISSPTHTTSFAGNYINQSRTELAAIGEMKVGSGSGATGAKLTIEAGGNAILQAASVSNVSTSGTTTIRAEGDVRLETVTTGSSDNTEYNAKNYQRRSQSQEVGSSVTTNGTTVIKADNDIDIRQGTVDAGTGLLSVQAGNNVNITAGQSTQTADQSVEIKRSGVLTKKTTTTQHSLDETISHGSTLSGGVVAITANNNIAIEGSAISGTDGVLVQAGNILSVFEARDSRSESESTTVKKSGFAGSFMGVPLPIGAGTRDAETSASNTAVASSITSENGGILLQGGGAALLQGVKVDADKDITIQGGIVSIAAATDYNASSSEHYTRGTNIGMSGWHDPGKGIDAKNTDKGEQQTSSLDRTELTGANVSITATGSNGNGGLLSIAGTTVNTPGTLTLSADQLVLGTQTTQTDIANTSHGGDWAWQAAKGQGSTDQTTNYNQFNVAQFNVGTLATPVKSVEVGLGARDSISALAQQPGMGWIAQINNDPTLSGQVDWAKVEEAHTNWHYSQQGLTPEAAAVVTLVVAYFTAGAASGAGATAGNAAAVTAGGGATGATISSVVGGAVTAGISTLAGQAAVALINNKGDIGGALDDLGSSASVKGLLTAIVTGGVLGGLNLNPTGLPTSGAGAQGVMVQLGQNLQAAAARAVIGTAINGGSLEDNLKAQLKTAFIDTFAAQVANQIGDWTKTGSLDGFTNKIAHAIAGCAIGAAEAESASGCGAGALGAAMGELSAELYGKQIDTVQFASMMAGIAAAIAGGDAAAINLASQTGANAAANNYLSHAEIVRKKRLQEELAKCTTSTCVDDKTAAIKELNDLNHRRDKELAAACQAPGSSACQQLQQEVRSFAAELVKVGAVDVIVSADGKHTLNQAVGTFDKGQLLIETGKGTVVSIAQGYADLFKVLADAVADPAGAAAQLKQEAQDIKEAVEWAAQHPEKYKEIIALTEQKVRDDLAAAIQSGDEVAVGMLLGTLAANFTPDPTKKAQSALKVLDEIKLAKKVEEVAKRADVDRVVSLPAGSKNNWDKTANGQLEPKTAYVLDNGHAYLTDSNGRVKEVGAELSQAKMDRNGYQQGCVGKCGEAGDEGGHLIAAALGGAGDRINIVPQAATLNRGDWRAMEREFMQALKEGKTVNVKVEVVYPATGGTRPSEFRVYPVIGEIALPPKVFNQ